MSETLCIVHRRWIGSWCVLNLRTGARRYFQTRDRAKPTFKRWDKAHWPAVRLQRVGASS